ncbi:hypothetical protein [Pseudomonas ceruminis]|uniref:hypothetical protein n=1 Tax=Pseudomonas ceruminis TaxID=2740516 RepID=UPI0015969724|nr:hypothetical protein [Pseudomonas ceruminis]
MNLKEFLVPTTLEVGRIIRGFETPSTFNFINLEYHATATQQADATRAQNKEGVIRALRLRTAIAHYIAQPPFSIPRIAAHP